MATVLIQWRLIIITEPYINIESRYLDAQGGRVRIHRVTGGLD